MQLSRLGSDFLRYKAARGGSPRTAENYQLAFDQFVGHLRTLGKQDDVREFTPENVESFLTALGEGGMKGSSMNLKLAALSSLADYGLRTKGVGGKYVLAENPVARVERPKRQKTQEKYLYAEELRALFAVEAHAEERLALRLLFDTQLRASELCDAKVRDLSLDGEAVVLQVRVKGGRPEQVTISAEIAEVLLDTLKHREAGPDEALVLGIKGRPYTRDRLSQMVLKLARRAGIKRIPVRAHVLGRHTPASLAGQSGANVFEVAAMLRHADISTAKRYVHGVSSDAARASVRALVGA